MSLENVYSLIKNFFGDDFDISILNLKHPDSVFVRDFYTRALMEFEVDVDELHRSNLLSDGKFADVETTDVNLVGAVNAVFNFLNFTYMDLMCPSDNVKRTATLMGQVMDFLNQCDGLMSRLDLESNSKDRDRIEVEEKENIKIKQEINKLETKKVKANDRMKEVENRLEMLSIKANKMRQDLIGKSSDLPEKLAMLRAESEKIAAECHQFENEIATSEECLRRMEELEKIDEQEEEWKKKVSAKHEELKALTKVFDSIEQSVANFDALATVLDKSTQLQESHQIQEENLKKMEDTFAKIRADLEIYSPKMAELISNLQDIKDSDVRLSVLLAGYESLVRRFEEARKEMYSIIKVPFKGV